MEFSRCRLKKKKKNGVGKLPNKKDTRTIYDTPVFNKINFGNFDAIRRKKKNPRNSPQSYGAADDEMIIEKYILGYYGNEFKAE